VTAEFASGHSHEHPTVPADQSDPAGAVSISLFAMQTCIVEPTRAVEVLSTS